MVVGGAPEETDDHAERVANFAIDMVLAAGQVKDPADKSKTIKVSIRQSLNTVTPCILPVVTIFVRYIRYFDTLVFEFFLSSATIYNTCWHFLFSGSYGNTLWTCMRGCCGGEDATILLIWGNCHHRQPAAGEGTSRQCPRQPHYLQVR